jgi:hypothetical protein
MLLVLVGPVLPAPARPMIGCLWRWFESAACSCPQIQAANEAAKKAAQPKRRSVTLDADSVDVCMCSTAMPGPTSTSWHLHIHSHGTFSRPTADAAACIGGRTSAGMWPNGISPGMTNLTSIHVKYTISHLL